MTGVIDVCGAMEILLQKKKAGKFGKVLQEAALVVAPDLYVCELRLFQNFSFWKSYLRFSRKTSQKAGFSKPFPKLTEFWKWLN